MLTIVELGNAAGDTQAKPSEPDEKSNKEKDAYGGPHFHAYRAFAFCETAMAAELTSSLERFRRFCVIGGWAHLLNDLGLLLLNVYHWGSLLVNNLSGRAHGGTLHNGLALRILLHI